MGLWKASAGSNANASCLLELIESKSQVAELVEEIKKHFSE